MRNLWLIFAQTVTASLAILFAIQIVNPNLFNFLHFSKAQPLTINQADSSAYAKVNIQNTFSHAVKKAMPSVFGVGHSRGYSHQSGPAKQVTELNGHKAEKQQVD